MIWLFATFAIFYTARWFAMKWRHPLNNPLLITVAILITLLVTLGVPYSEYYRYNTYVNALLQPAVVAFAYPLYEQMHQIRARWKLILGMCLLGTIVAMLTGGVIALSMGADPTLAASILPKSVTTPIAMAVSEQIQGEPAIAAVMVIIAGFFGMILGYPLFSLLRIADPLARGLTMGTMSHALGTSKAAEVSYEEGAFSSLALVICGVITSLLAPIMFPLLMTIF
ncbi:Inner membrane protein YohK [Vibrio stylophorae]|uniref:Inner membrane protein YohK n=1 Tax=Vibrio stylophorae TaxID=659351 RepID=A0ABN8DS54_9VIBR|nr:CidB/LrgB family autolysis modulator [Vibrio stylophorae]CAH0533163.1 Inner membrane protein YohK [Vibrio stylophorae]